MESSFYYCAAAITFFTLLCTIFFMFYKKLGFHPKNQPTPSSTSSSSSSSSFLALSSPPSSLSRNRKYHVFPSFHGADVRKNFLPHVLKEFRGKGIDIFIDNDIKRSMSIGPELEEAIRGSRIAIVLLSKNYASSSWCLNELVEIMRCRKELDQIVMTIFYEVDPTEVKKQTGDFGKAFRKTCKGKTKEEIETWRKVLEDVATIAGEHSSRWENDALMIEKIATDVSNMLNHSTPSRDFDSLVGMEAHREKMELLLRLDLEDEVRMIGIWGPPGIGKTTIARYLYSQISNSFQMSVFIDNVKELMYTKPVCSDDYSTKMRIQKQFMSRIINYKDMEIPNLGVIQDRLSNKKVLIVLDNIDELIYLDAIAKESWWFGLGSRIIITTQNQRLLKAHNSVNHIYEVAFPSEYEAYQIFCVHAFGQKFPEDGFEELVWQVTELLGNLPLGLRVMGSYFRGMSKEEWIDALPRLRTHLDGNIESILKFSYDALDKEEKDLFLYIACFFSFELIEKVEEILAKTFSHVRHSLRVLIEKSLITLYDQVLNEAGKLILMHELLIKLGRERICHELGQKTIREPGKRRFLVGEKDAYEVLSDNKKDSKNVIGLCASLYEFQDEFDISESAFKRMSNLQFLRFCPPDSECGNEWYLPPRVLYYGNYLPGKLKELDWHCFHMTYLPSNFRTECLVKLNLRYSKLQKLWEGDQPLGNLKWMNLSHSKYLEKLPDLSTATSLQGLFMVECSSLVELLLSDENVSNLKTLDLSGCSKIMELPSSIANATNLQKLCLNRCTSLVELPSSFGNNVSNLSYLSLSGCSRLVKLPFSIGNATNLQKLYLECTSLVELPSSIGNLHKLKWLHLKGCSKLEVFPTNINLKSLEHLGCSNCVSLRSFPDISTSIKAIDLAGTAIKEVPSSIKSWSQFEWMQISYFENFQDFPHAFDFIRLLYLNDRDIQDIPLSVKRISGLKNIVLDGCKSLVSIPQLSDSLSCVQAEKCESLERLDCLFQNPEIRLNFTNCLKLNKEARELIIQTSQRAVLPGREVPAHFAYRFTSGSSMRVNLNQSPLSTTSKLKACISLVDKGVTETGDRDTVKISYSLGYKKNGRPFGWSRYAGVVLPALHSEHLYIVEFETKDMLNEIVLDFEVISDKWGMEKAGSYSLIKRDSELKSSAKHFDSCEKFRSK